MSNNYSRLLITGFLVATLSPELVIAQSVTSPAVQSNEQSETSSVDSIAALTAMFKSAAEQWVANNVTNDPWNSADSTTPSAFGTYSPIFLYAGPNTALCGAPAAATQWVNLVTSDYLPANFTPPYSGEYCAIIYPDSGTSSVTGPVGANGGTTLVPVSSVLAYFVEGSNTEDETTLSNSESPYVIAHLAPLIAQNYAAGGQVFKYSPTISNGGGTSTPTWQSVTP